MALSINEETFSSLSEALLSAGYKIESIKCVHKSALVDNPRGFFNGLVLRICRMPFFKPLPKNSFAELSKILSSAGFSVNAIKTIRNPFGFKAIKIMISN